MRQKKRARFHAMGSQTEKLIAELTQRRSSLFEALENEIQIQAIPIHNIPSVITQAQAQTTLPLLDDDVLESATALDNDDSNDGPVPDSLSDKVVTEKRGHTLLAQSHHRNEEDSDASKRINILRKDAADTDEQLQQERTYLQSLRSALAASLSRLDELEVKLCIYSEEWEGEERERLSVELRPQHTLKRSRSNDNATLNDTKSQTKRVMTKAAETLVVLGLGAGLAVAKQAYL